MSVYTITIPGLPPSVNRTGQHWSIRRRAHQDWYEIVAAHALGLKIPRPVAPSCVVEIELRYKGRPRDSDSAVKLLLDALSACRIIADDSYPALHETRLRARPAAVEQVVLTIREAE